MVIKYYAQCKHCKACSISPDITTGCKMSIQEAKSELTRENYEKWYFYQFGDRSVHTVFDNETRGVV